MYRMNLANEESNNMGYKPIFVFNEQSDSFVHGFDCGQIWAMLKHHIDVDNFTTLAINQPQIEAICHYYKVLYTITELSDGWIKVFAHRPEQIHTSSPHHGD